MSDNRPLSPHLDIYRWRITMMCSILHRASGVFICFGLCMFAVWLAYIAFTSEIPKFGEIISLFWFVWTLAIYYHMCNGIRHLAWDVGRGLNKESATKSAKYTIIAAFVLTLLTWIII